MIDHAGTDESVPSAIKIDPPRIARAIGKNLEFFGARMIASHSRIYLYSAVFRVCGVFHHRVSENPVGHIKPAVRTPGEAVQKLMSIIQAKAGFYNGPFIGL